MPKNRRKQPRYSIALPDVSSPGKYVRHEVSAKIFHHHLASGHLEQTSTRTAKLRPGRDYFAAGNSLRVWVPESVHVGTYSAYFDKWYLKAHNGTVPLVVGFRGAVSRRFHWSLAARIIEFVERRQREWAVELDCASLTAQLYRDLVRKISEAFTDFQATLPEGYRNDRVTLSNIWQLLVRFFAPVRVATA